MSRLAARIRVDEQMDDPGLAPETYERVRRDLMAGYARFSARSAIAELVSKERIAAGLEPAVPVAQ